MKTTEERIQSLAVHMVAFAIKGRRVSKAEKVELMQDALDKAEKLVVKQGA